MFLTSRFYIVMAVASALMAAGVVYSPLFLVGQWSLVLLVMAVVVDILVLYSQVRLKASRLCASRFSLGDDNEVRIRLANLSSLALRLKVIDELPIQLQNRDFSMRGQLDKGESREMNYSVRPLVRGEYSFGDLLVFVSTGVGLAERRLRFAVPMTVKVYPSFLMLRQYELMATTDNLSEMGIKRVRLAGNNTEFEQIKDYVQGDDYRTINWKASARRSHLMVNVYEDERSQQVFSLIDKGRLMQQSFGGMTFLEYAINASLVFSYVAIHRQDKAGVITFDDKMGSFVPAERSSGQMQRILESLYALQTSFGESDYSILCPNVDRLVGRRSFFVLYTNFTDFSSLERQLPYLRLLNQRHRLLVVFFEDVELSGFTATPVHDIEDCYQHVIAEKLAYERRLIISTLKQNGIYGLLTSPQRLTVDVINRYVEMKTRHLLV